MYPAEPEVSVYPVTCSRTDPPALYCCAANWMICCPSGVILYLSQSKKTRNSFCGGGGGGAGGNGGGGAGAGIPNFIVTLATMLCVW